MRLNPEIERLNFRETRWFGMEGLYAAIFCNSLAIIFSTLIMQFTFQASKQITLLATFLVFLNTYAQFSTVVDKTAAEKLPGSQKDAAPDYSNLYYWASHPLKHDAADSIPSFLKNEKKDSSADVFFLHPTTYTKDFAKASWNASVNDEALNRETDNRPILFQASVFNGSCRVYAPRYRQAHIKAFFMVNSPQAFQALDTAYEDLKTAFQYYLDHYNHGRPIIIASHSQGSLHAIRLLKDFFENKPLQKQLVCAYVVGWQIKKDEFKTIPFGETPSATGCVVGWRSYKNGYVDFMASRENGNALCINPVTWTTSDELSPKSMHKGMIGRNFNLLYDKSLTVKVNKDAGVLWVDLPGNIEDALQRTNNYHIADYNLFYMDIRENVKQRINAFLHKSAP